MKNFIVFDLEWNQNPGGKEASVERLPFEIFEIGAVKLNEEREKVAEFHRIIRPCVYRQMHRIISEVTHVSIEELERDGEPFAAVMEDFLKWCGEDCIFCTWGSMDLTELQRNMVYHGMTIPFPKPFLFYDVQKLYSLCYQDGKARISLDEAVESFALDVDAPFHRALGDAEYTGRVMRAMDFESVKDYVSVDYYMPPESEDEEFTLLLLLYQINSVETVQDPFFKILIYGNCSLRCNRCCNNLHSLFVIHVSPPLTAPRRNGRAEHLRHLPISCGHTGHTYTVPFPYRLPAIRVSHIPFPRRLLYPIRRCGSSLRQAMRPGRGVCTSR